MIVASSGALGGLLAWLLIPVPLLAGLVPMLCGNWAVRRLLASGPGRRGWQWRGTLGVSLGGTGIGVAWFVGMLLWRVVGV